MNNRIHILGLFILGMCLFWGLGIVSAQTLTAPSNFRITATGQDSITFAWTDTSYETAYYIERSDNGGTSWVISTISANIQSYNYPSIYCDTTYQFRLRAYRSSDSSYSAYTDVIEGTTAACTPLNAPSDLQVSATDYKTITISWTDNSTNETGFTIQRSEDNGLTWSSTGASQNQTTHTSGPLTCGTSYQFRVRASSYTFSVQKSTEFIYLTTSTLDCMPPMEAVSDLAVSVTGQFYVALVWTANTPSPTIYKIERSSDAGATWTELQGGSFTTSASTGGLNCASTYHYRIRTLQVDGVYSPYSNVVAVTTNPCTPPIAPSNLQFTAVTQTSINLAWTNNEVEYTSFDLQRSTNNFVNWTEILVSKGDSSRTISSLTCGTTYLFRIRIHRTNDNAYSPYSNVLSVTTSECPPPAPTSLTSSNTTYNSVKLTWVDNASNETSYFVVRSSAGGWVTVAELPANTSTYTVTGLACGTLYLHRVRAYRSGDNLFSADSNSRSTTTTACPSVSAPTNLTMNTSGQAIQLSWTDTANNETNYALERSSDGGVTWTQFGLLPANSTTYTDMTIVCGQNYSYRVRAYSNIGSYSTYSATVSGAKACPESVCPAGSEFNTGIVGSYQAGPLALSSDGSRVALTYGLPTEATNLYDVASQTQIAHFESGMAVDLDGDGSHLVLRSSEDFAGTNADGSEEIFLWNEGVFTQISSNNLNVTDTWPQISDDGSKIVFRAEELSNSNEYLYSWDAVNGLQKIIPDALESTDNFDALALSRDGSTVAFVSSSDLAGISGLSIGQIYLWDSVNGLRLMTALTDSSELDIFPYSFTINEDGTRIAFSAFNNLLGQNADRTLEVFVWDAGSGLEQLSNDATNGNFLLSMDAAGHRLFLVSPNNYGGMNADAQAEYYIWDSSLGYSQVSFTNRLDWMGLGTSLSADGSVLAMILPNIPLSAGTEPYPYLRLYVLNCDPSPAVPERPAAPTNLAASLVGYDDIALSWLDNASDESNYRIQRSVDNGLSWTSIASPAANSTTYTDTTVPALSCGTEVLYRVQSYRSSDTTYSVAAETSSPAPECEPRNPTNLRTTTNTATLTVLAWDDNSILEDAYYLELSWDGLSWEVPHYPALSANTTTYYDTDTRCGTVKYYRVRNRDYDTQQYSEYSNVLEVTVPDCSETLGAPEHFLTLGTSTNAIRLRAHYHVLNGETPIHDLEFQISTDGSNWTTFSKGRSNSDALSNNLSCNTNYQYRVRGFDYDQGTRSAYTYLNETTEPCVLEASTYMSSSGASFYTHLLWINPYQLGTYSNTLERSDDGGLTWEVIEETIQSSYSDYDVICESSYQYRVMHHDPINDLHSPYTAVETINTYVCTLDAPTNFMAQGDNDSISLSWDDNSSEETHYWLERSADGLSWTEIAELNANSTSYEDTNVSCDVSYHYRVRAYRYDPSYYALHEHEYSSLVYATGSCGLLSAPTNLIVTDTTNDSISLAWTDNASNETDYRLEVSLDGITWSILDIVPANTSSYTVIDLFCDDAFEFRLRAYRAGDEQFSDYSNLVTGATSACPAPLAASDLTVTANSHNSISLAWIDNASNETGYRLERSADAGLTWTEIAQPPANSTSITDTLSCASVYHYRVRAYRAGDNQFSAYSNIVAGACAAPLAPTALTVSANSHNSVSLSWTDNAVNESSYRVERSTNGGADWVILDSSLLADANSYTDSGLSCAVSYQYRVRANRFGDSQNSEYSNLLTATCAAPLAASDLTVTATNETSIELAWTDNASNETGYRLERSEDNGTSWNEIALLPADAVAYENLALDCDTAYQYRLRAYRIGDSQNSDYSNVVTGATSACPAPLAASDLTVTANSHNSISLAWIDNANDETEYRLERSADAGSSWTEIAQLAVNSTSYDDMPDCLEIYHYRVRAYRAGNNQYSDYSNVVSATCAAPLAATGLMVTDSSQSSISLAWTDNATNETSYRLERSTDAGASWTLLVSLGSDATSHNDINLNCTSSYHYRVVAHRAGDSQNSAYSEVITATCAAPLSPTDLTVTGTSATSISLRWTDVSTNETAYLLERSDDNGTSWTEIAQLAVNGANYDNIELDCASSYDYRVRAYRSSDAQYSAYSNIITATSDNCAVLAPTELAITGMTATSISLSWTDNASDETEYRLERSDDGIGWTEIAQAEADSTSYSDTSLSCALTYDYRIRAYRADDESYSAYSNVVTETTDNCPPPATPTGLTITGTSQSSLSLAWMDNASNETSYSLERSLDGTNWAEIQALVANSTRFENTGLNCNTGYAYRVRAYRSGDTSYSSYSNVATGTTSACPAPLAPTGLTVTGTSQSSVSLSWTDNASDETAYELERSEDSGTNWISVGNPAPNTTSFSDTTVACNTSYDYRVRAYRSGDVSAYSNTVTGTTTACISLNAPTNIQQTANSQTGMSLSWTDNSTNESGYEIERSLDGTNWTILSSLPANSTSYTDSGLSCSTGYQYRIRSKHSGTATYSPYGSSGVLTTASCPALIASVLSSTGATQNSISLSWTADTNGTSFTLAYYNGTSWVNLGIFPSTTTSYTHTGLSCNRSYQYQVTTFRVTDSASVTSSSFSTSTSACPPLAAPNAPIVVNTEPALVSLQIPALPATATSMSLERSTDGLSWTNLGTVSTNYLDTAVVCSGSYQYRLVAVRSSDGVTSTSATSVAITDACPIPTVVGIYRNGLWVFVDSNNTATPVNSFNFGDASWQALVGDWDGDGVDGVGIYRNGEFALRNLASADSPENRFNFGNAEAGWQAIVGDWNGDGIDSVGLYKDGIFTLSDDNSNIQYRFNFGFQQAGWQVVAGDWDGNGTDGIGLYKDGLWMLANDVNQPDASSQSISYGPNQAGWTAIVGDWNGDGMDSIGLYANGIWRMRTNSVNDATETSLNFGQTGDIPLAIFEN